jgi:hypothetical protein
MIPQRLVNYSSTSSSGQSHQDIGGTLQHEDEDAFYNTDDNSEAEDLDYDDSDNEPATDASSVASDNISENSDAPSELEWINFYETFSKRNKSLLEYGGHEWGFDKLSKSMILMEFWRCPRRPLHQHCKSRICVTRDWSTAEDGRRFKKGYFKNPVHSHEANNVSSQIRKAQKSLRDEAKSTFPGNTREVVGEVRSGMSLAARVGASSRSMTKLYTSQKQQSAKRQGDTGLDAIPPVIPAQILQRTLCNEGLGGGRIIVFASDWAVNYLAQQPNVSVDGTFKVRKNKKLNLRKMHRFIKFRSAH